MSTVKRKRWNKNSFIFKWFKILLLTRDKMSLLQKINIHLDHILPQQNVQLESRHSNSMIHLLYRREHGLARYMNIIFRWIMSNKVFICARFFSATLSICVRWKWICIFSTWWEQGICTKLDETVERISCLNPFHGMAVELPSLPCTFRHCLDAHFPPCH